MYFTAVVNTISTMGPYYAKSVYNWVKAAVWDAPLRVYLDVELEFLNLSRSQTRQSQNNEQ